MEWVLVLSLIFGFVMCVYAVIRAIESAASRIVEAIRRPQGRSDDRVDT